MNTNIIWKNYKNSLYFFILKMVKNSGYAEDILQTTFLKIHQNLHQLKNEKKTKAWVFQIARNEINNFYQQENYYSLESISTQKEEEKIEICCFDKSIKNLPQKYQTAIELVYKKGFKQKEAAKKMHISLANLKARIRRGKKLMQEYFLDCCKFKLNKEGNLIGKPNCASCNT